MTVLGDMYWLPRLLLVSTFSTDGCSWKCNNCHPLIFDCDIAAFLASGTGPPLFTSLRTPGHVQTNCWNVYIEKDQGSLT